MRNSLKFSNSRKNKSNIRSRMKNMSYALALALWMTWWQAALADDWDKKCWSNVDNNESHYIVQSWDGISHALSDMWISYSHDKEDVEAFLVQNDLIETDKGYVYEDTWRYIQPWDCLTYSWDIIVSPEIDQWFYNSKEATLSFATDESNNAIYVPKDHLKKLSEDINNLIVELRSLETQQQVKNNLLRKWAMMQKYIDYPFTNTNDVVQIFDDVLTMMRINNARYYIQNMDWDEFANRALQFGKNWTVKSWTSLIKDQLRLKRILTPNIEFEESINYVKPIVESEFEKLDIILPEKFKLFVFWLINTESIFNNFNVSNTGVVGYTQLITDSYLWRKHNWLDSIFYETVNPYNKYEATSRAIEYLNFIYNKFEEYKGKKDYNIYEIVFEAYYRWHNWVDRLLENYWPNRSKWFETSYYNGVLIDTAKMFPYVTWTHKNLKSASNENLVNFASSLEDARISNINLN